jgi:hypothetical protein
VLLVQESFGVHEHPKDVCRRFATQGYCAVAAELYARQGDVSQYTDYRDIMSKVVSKVPDAQVMSDLDAAARWADKNGGDAKRVGVSGFCWGGRIVWLYAAHSKDLKAGVAGTAAHRQHERVAARLSDRRRGKLRRRFWVLRARDASRWPMSRRCGCAGDGKDSTEDRVFPTRRMASMPTIARATGLPLATPGAMRRLVPSTASLRKCVVPKRAQHGRKVPGERCPR